jgi:glycosyltransferase involved in cell wall biosynthesis
MFVRAIAQLSDELEVLHFVSADWMAANPDLRDLDESQSAHWGTPVRVTVAVLRDPPREGWRYALSMVSLAARPRFSRFTGAAQLQALAACLARRPDLVFVHRLTCMIPLLQLHQALPPLFFDLDDIEHRVKIRTALADSSLRSKLSNLLQVPAIYWSERRAVRRSMRTYLCSEDDCRYLRRVGIRDGVTSIANAVSLPLNVTAPSRDATILFLGGYDYPPNAQAAERLITRIWPRIRAKFRNARLLIAGGSPQLIPSFSSRPSGVEFSGFVQDLHSVYDRTRLICSPICIGGGTRVKLIEAAAWGRPMVSTSMGAEGLLFENGTEILIQDDDELIARDCARLLEDYSFCLRMATAARQRASSVYEAGAVCQRITESMRGGLETSVPRSG